MYEDTFTPLVVTDPLQHTMEDSLYGYLDLKVHEYVRTREYRKILIIGDDGRLDVSRFEKRDKPFNWQRPGATITHDELHIHCYPGRDYVRHYASITATYLALHQRRYDHVRYVLRDESFCRKALLRSNILEIPKGDIAILSFGLDQLIGYTPQWEGEGAFSWHQKKIGNMNAIFIGFRPSYWGDVAGRVVSILAELGFKQVVYVGKLGALQKDVEPNVSIATGSLSFVEGEIVQWDNLFSFTKGRPGVVFGDHVSCPSILFETKEWLYKNQAYDFVDPEIGHMAKEGVSAGIQFSYFHVISDSLCLKFDEDLSNERKGAIREKRKVLLNFIREVFEEIGQGY